MAYAPITSSNVHNQLHLMYLENNMLHTLSIHFINHISQLIALQTSEKGNSDTSSGEKARV